MGDYEGYKPSNTLFTQERISRYRPGGYHPVSLDDTFKDGRYTVYHKLGWGGYSTVWLAWDSTLDLWVSIKIKTADSSKRAPESETWRALRKSIAPGHIVELFDEFVHSGPNGDHQCLVFEFLGPTVDFVVDRYHDQPSWAREKKWKPMKPTTSLKLSTQLLQGIASIHAAGYVHGDINGSNIAFTSSKIARLSEDDLFDIIGYPYNEDLVRLDGKPLDPGVPKELVEAVDWEEWAFEDEEDIRIIDFGESFTQGSQPDELAQPVNMRVPETMLSDHFDYRIDIWRAGITIFSALFGYRPFNPFDGINGMIQQVFNLEGEIPSEWIPRWEQIQKDAGIVPKIALTDGVDRPEIETKFEHWRGNPDLKAMFPVIRGLARLRPSDRISIDEALVLIAQIKIGDPDDRGFACEEVGEDANDEENIDKDKASDVRDKGNDGKDTDNNANFKDEENDAKDKDNDAKDKESNASDKGGEAKD